MSEPNYEGFLQALTDLYGDYNQAQRKVALKWLEDAGIERQQLQRMYLILIEKHSTRWKTPPWIPEFIDAKKTAAERAAIHATLTEFERDMIDDGKGGLMWSPSNS